MTVLAGRYELTQRIAIGGMGEVWRARDTVLDRTVAVKLLKPEYVADESFLARFRNEAKHTAALSHPGIANVFDYGETDDAPTDDGRTAPRTAYLVMEYVDGEPLSAILSRQKRLAPDRTLDVVGQAALALDAAHHAGVIHRDVKPGNLIVRPDGVVKVTDFGVARAINAAPVTQTGMVVGTAAYLSPEQAAGRDVTAASDVYALGLVTYECLAGRRAFDGDSAVAVATAQVNDAPPALPNDVPPLVSAFAMRALEKDPERRQPDAGDFGRTALALSAALRTGEESAAAPAAPRVAPAAGEAGVAHLDDAERRRIRNIFVAVGAAVVVVGFLLLRACDAAPAPHRATASTAPSPTPTGTTVAVRRADLLGRPVASARTSLRAKGLTVRVTWSRSTAPPGSVVGVAPSGNLPKGATVTLVAAMPPPAPPAHGGKKQHGHGGHGDH